MTLVVVVAAAAAAAAAVVVVTAAVFLCCCCTFKDVAAFVRINVNKGFWENLVILAKILNLLVLLKIAY